jgi:4'-phosphopantetheinyl transferase
LRARAPQLRAGEVIVWRTAPGEGVLREIVGGHLGIDPAEVELTFGPQGKPVLAAGATLSFNLSHSSDVALVAVACDREVGVDVEEIRPRHGLLALARRAFGPDVGAELERLDPPAQTVELHRRWTAHEAALKCAGTGLAGPPPAGVTVRPIDVGPGFAAAVAAPGSDWSPRVLPWDG